MATSGGNAYQITVDVFNDMWRKANEMANRSDAWLNRAEGFNREPMMIGSVVVDDSFWELPDRPTLPDADDKADEMQNIFDANRDHLVDLMTKQFADFIRKFIPRPEVYDRAMDWCDRAVTTGGTGINRAVEQQLWSRHQARVMGEAAASEKEAMTQFAARGFPLPSGALLGRLHDVRLDANKKLAEQSRDIAIKAFETEVENVRFAVEQIFSQRQVVLAAAGDYIKALALGPELAMKLATSVQQLESDLAKNLVAMYQAEIAAMDPLTRIAIKNAELAHEVDAKNQAAMATSNDARLKAALQGAQTAGQMASAGLNAINASASVGSSDSFRFEMT